MWTLIICSVGWAFSAEILDIDLAEQPPGSEVTRPLVPGDYMIRMVNRLPKSQYAVTVALEHEDIKPLPLDGVRGEKPEFSCDNWHQSVEAEILSAKNETAVKTAIDLIRTNSKECAAEVRHLIEGDLTTLTTLGIQPAVTVAAGKRLTVTIHRRNDNKEVVATWIRVYTTGARGEWRTSYGFNFSTISLFLVVPKRPPR
jgi:hypothetical protein